MITLFILGAFIGAGSVMISELIVENKELKKINKELGENNNENVCSGQH